MVDPARWRPGARSMPAAGHVAGGTLSSNCPVPGREGRPSPAQLLRTPGPPRSELLGCRRALLRPQGSLLSSAHAPPSELVPTDRAQSELVCLPSPAVTSAAKTGSVPSAEESYQLNPKDTLQSPASSGAPSPRRGVTRRWSRCRALTC